MIDTSADAMGYMDFKANSCSFESITAADPTGVLCYGCTGEADNHDLGVCRPHAKSCKEHEHKGCSARGLLEEKI